MLLDGSGSPYQHSWQSRVNSLGTFNKLYSDNDVYCRRTGVMDVWPGLCAMIAKTKYSACCTYPAYGNSLVHIRAIQIKSIRIMMYTLHMVVEKCSASSHNKFQFIVLIPPPWKKKQILILLTIHICTVIHCPAPLRGIRVPFISPLQHIFISFHVCPPYFLMR